MPQSNFRKKNKLSSKKRNRAKLEYQRCEDRNLLAADLSMGPVAINATGFEFGQSSAQLVALSQQFQQNDTIASLEQGLNGLVEVASETRDGQTTTVLQQTWNGLPVFDAYVTVVQDSNGDITNVRDQSRKNIRGYALDSEPVSADLAADNANRTLGKPVAVESSVSQAWYYAGNKARLAHLVETAVSNSQGEVVGEYETWVNLFNGDILNQRTLNASVEGLLEDPIRETGVFPRIVINDTIGEQGSRDYAAPFDSVVSISVGCTGTLISPDTVISARHCGIGAGDTVSFGDNSGAPEATFSIASSLNPAGGNAGSPLLDGGDVSLHTLTTSVPASVATPMRFIDATDDLVGLTAVTVGYGWNGVGSVGHQFSADGFRWGGENVIDAFGSPEASFGSNIISTDFDDGTLANNTIPSSSSTPLTFEATTAPGDSGGPILVDVSGEWVIAGVLSGGTDGNSFYGDISWWTGTTLYRSEIEDAGGTFVGQVGPGTVEFDRETYFVGDTIGVQVRDFNATGDIEVTVTSDTGDMEVVTVSPDSAGAYSFTLESAFANIVFNDGTLQLNEGDQITVSYTDIDDGEGNSFVVTDTADIIEMGPPALIGLDFDSTGVAPFNWTSASGNGTFLDLTNENAITSNVDLEVIGTASAFAVDLNASTIPQHPNSIDNVNGQIFTNAQSVSFVYSDLNPMTQYQVFVMSAEGFFESIEQTVTIQGDGSPVSFEQRFDQGDLFVNGEIGDSSRELLEYAQLIVSDANGEITIDIDPIAGTSDVVVAGLAILEVAAEGDSSLRVTNDFAITNEDQSVNINVLANDYDAEGAPVMLDAVSNAQNGSVSLGPTGTVNYTPNANFSGTDTFTYTISNLGGDTATGTATVQILEVNDTPTGILLSPSLVREDADITSDVVIGSLTGVDVDDATHTFALTAGAGDTDNDLFKVENGVVSLKAGTNINFNTQPQYSIRVSSSDGEYTIEQILNIVVIDVEQAATVTLNGGDNQRSMITESVIAFDGIVTFGANPFELVKRGTGGGPVTVTPSIDNSTGNTIVTLTFSGNFVAAGGSLMDGNYQLTIFGDQVTTADGTAFDGDNDGVAGGDFVFGDTETDNFFRFFGDDNGDRIISAIDVLGFRRTWLEDSSEPGYDAKFDYDANGVVSALDLLQFRRNYLDRLEFDS